MNKQPRILHLHLKGRWFDQIASGEKTVELRRQTEYWRKRLIGQHYDEIRLYRGYPKAGDVKHMLRRRWQLVAPCTVVHPEFGSDPVAVFSIDVSQPIAATR